MKTQHTILLVVEDNEMPERQSLKLIHELAEKVNAQLHLFLDAYEHGYENPIKPNTRKTKRKADHIVEARNSLSQLKNTLNSDSVVSGETLNWKHPISETIPSLISTLAPQYIIAIRPRRNLFKRNAPSRKHWDILSTCGVPVIFSDPDFKISLSREVWAAVSIESGQDGDSPLNDMIVRQAQTLADLYGGDVHLMHSHYTGYELTQYLLSLSKAKYVSDEQQLRQSRDEHQTVLERMARKFNIPPEHIHNLPGLAKVVIPIVSSRRRPLFIVAGATEKNRIEQWLTGSTAKMLIKRLTIPLVIVCQSPEQEYDDDSKKNDGTKTRSEHQGETI